MEPVKVWIDRLGKIHRNDGGIAGERIEHALVPRADFDALVKRATAADAVVEALERCVEVMDEQPDAVSSGGEEWDAVLEQARAALRGATGGE